MISRKKLIAALLGACLAASAATLDAGLGVRTADAAIVERVVAVVGDKPILLSELRHRARPYLFRIASQVSSPAQQAAAETEMFRDVLNRMIDDRLEEVAADKGHLSVTSEEVDTAIKNVAANARLPVKELFVEAARQGLTEQDYRDEIRRQLLEGKLVQLRVRGRVRVTEQDARSSYGRWVRDVGDQSMIDARILALRLAPGANDTQIQQRAVDAEAIITRARAGEDFCKLVATFSEDVQTKGTCGSRGPVPANAYAGVPPLNAALQTMKPGDISDPIVVPGEAVLVVQFAGSRVPAFEEVKDAMTERAFSEAMERQRKLWLQEIRAGLYVDVRL